MKDNNLNHQSFGSLGLADTSNIPMKEKNKQDNGSLMTNDSFIKSLTDMND
jgi:hypothetical protein